MVNLIKAASKWFWVGWGYFWIWRKLYKKLEWRKSSRIFSWSWCSISWIFTWTPQWFTIFISKKVEKLVATLNDAEEHAAHIRNLKQTLDLVWKNAIKSSSSIKVKSLAKTMHWYEYWATKQSKKQSIKFFRETFPFQADE